MKKALLSLALAATAAVAVAAIDPAPAEAQRRGAPKTKADPPPDTMICPGCFGTGETIIRGRLKTCPVCKGKGEVPATPPKKPN